MSLMQLLTVGRSLRNIVDQPHRYKMTRANLLPKFGSGKGEDANAFAGIVAEESETEPVEMASANLSPGIPSDAVGSPPVEAASRASAAEQAATSSLTSPRGRGTWLSKGVAQQPGSKAQHDPVRGERTLDAVKVVRNDLSDADPEVVPAQAAPASAQAATPTADSTGGLALLRRITARVFGARRT